MVGFLHFRDLNKLQPDLQELKPKYWRFRWQETSVRDVDFLIKNGVTPILILSDTYGYPQNLGKNWNTPLISNDYKSVTQNIYSKLGNKVIYDLWNEPYMEDFGGFAPEKFFSLFKQTHDAIRSMPGGESALITGPAFDHFSLSDIDDFLKFCNENKVRVDVLSWHDWRLGADVKKIQDDISKIKTEILPKYPSLGVKKIVLTEIIHGEIQFSPTQVYKVFDALEKSKIDGACRSCFGESNGVFNCETNTLGGLLDQAGKPRSVWWATKFYSQSVENRVQSKTDLDDLISFASYNQKSAYLLLANNYKKSIKNNSINLSNLFNLSIFRNYKKLKLNIYKIPTTGEQALDKPIFVSSKTIQSKGKSTNINVKELLPQEILYFTITK
ncbi:hypothetical protein [Epilithonimonas sp. UC225_85]|uniref:GH39 family glycosyl hydrolase n=1 Tax=Epilithonimonas sp. UC225_85 TaxID=3350167 RepID=UPI0036D43ADC